MNVVDVAVALLSVSALAGGYRVGFVARLAGWVGIGLGVLVASRAVPWVIARVGSDPMIRLLLVAALFVACSAIGASIGEVVGSVVRRSIPRGPARVADHLLGAVAGVIAVAVVLWLLTPAFADAPPVVSTLARNSRILQNLDESTPTPPDSIQALRSLVGGNDFPQVFESLRPAPDTGPPPSAPALTPQVAARVAASAVRVRGEACGRIQSGSGFVAGTDLVVTNAHVVAGVLNPVVFRPDGRAVDARAVVFDPDRDLALLQAPGLGLAPLPVDEPDTGAEGAVFGHPGGQLQLEVSPARIQQRATTIGRDIYDRNRVTREVLYLAAELRPGDSGGALVDSDGEVVGVAFAIAPDRSATAYALADDELRAVLDEPRNPAVGTGPCIR